MKKARQYLKRVKRKIAVRLYNSLTPKLIEHVRLFTTNWQFQNLTLLTKKDILDLGFIKANDPNDEFMERVYYYHPDIKERDRVWVEFDGSAYRVFHGNPKTFIALETSKYWLIMYLSLVWGDETFNQLP